MRRARRFWCFAAGWLCGLNAIGIEVDTRFGSGPAFADYVRDHWIDSAITLPIHVSLVVLSLVALVYMVTGMGEGGES